MTDEQQGLAVAWQSESMSALAQQLRSRGDDVSLDAATWLERFAKPQPAAVDADAIQHILKQALRDGVHGGYTAAFIESQIAALSAQGQGDAT